MALSSIYSMAGEIGVHYLEQFAPAVPCHGRLLLGVAGRLRLLCLRSVAAIININNSTTHNLQFAARACVATHFFGAHGNTHVHSSRPSGTKWLTSVPDSPERKADTNTLALQLSAVLVSKLFVLCHSRGICFRRAVLQRSQNEN